MRIADRPVGDGHPCFVIAEAGSNHNARLDMALQLIDVAAEAKADAVKFQLFRARTLYPVSAGQSAYLNLPKNIYEIIEKMELPTEWLPLLAAAGHARGLRFCLSVFDEALVDLAEPYVDFYKIASYEVTHLPLIRHVAAKGKPTVMSTGTADLKEVAEAVETFRAMGNDQLCLMQCSAAYPAPFDALNLRSIPTMHEAFEVPVGLSDHSRDPLVAPVAAVALGASLLEKHYTLANILPGPDHSFALEPRELVSMVAAVRATEAALGTGVKVAMPVEEELRQFARRTVFALRRIETGEVLTRENTAVLRAGRHPHGLPPGAWQDVLGRRACRIVQAETPLRWDDLER